MKRDRRVLMSTLVMPVFMIALFVMLIGFVSQQVKKPSVMKIGVVGMSPSEMVGQLDGKGDEHYVFAESELDARSLIASKAVRAAVIYPPDYLGKLKDGHTTVRVLYSSDDPLSGAMLGGLKAQIADGNKKIAAAVLEKNGINPELAEAVRVEGVDIAKKDGLAGSEIVTLIPYLIVIWAFYGGMSIVSDLVAGEKERGTMETILISPIKRAEVALGKILALGVTCFASSMTTLVGVALLAAVNLPQTREMFPNGVQISPLGLGAIVLVLVSLCTLFASLMVGISASARNIRESQTYLSLLSFLVLMPAIFSQFIGFTGAEKAAWVSYVPVLNSSMAIRNGIKGEVDLMLIAPTVFINVAIGFVCVLWAVRQFRREEILLRV